MSTEVETISGWFSRGVAEGHHWMIVVCDTFDHSDYPVYLDTPKKTLSKIAQPGEMQQVMEVYDLTLPKDPQMHEARAWHPPTPSSAGVSL